MSIAKTVNANLDGCTNLPQMKNRYNLSSRLKVFFNCKVFLFCQGTLFCNIYTQICSFQRYKEGKTILERALIKEREGFDEEKMNSSRARFLQDTDESN